MIALTFDIDWAPDTVLADTLELVAEAGVPTTLFATHATPLLSGSQACEIALHPNFLRGGDPARVLDDIMEIHPEARGIRTHSFVQSTPILDLFARRGLAYDSSVLMFRCVGATPYRYWNGLARIPVFWEDDINFMAGGAWDPGDLGLTDTESLHVFDFHPVHVFLNTESMERYAAAKPHYHDAARLRDFMNPESTGTGARVFLKRLLNQIRTDAIPTTLLRDVAARMPEGAAS